MTIPFEDTTLFFADNIVFEFERATCDDFKCYAETQLQNLREDNPQTSAEIVAALLTEQVKEEINIMKGLV